MSMLYCFEKAHIKKTLDKCKRSDLAVVDTEGNEKAVRTAVNN